MFFHDESKVFPGKPRSASLLLPVVISHATTEKDFLAISAARE